GACAYGHLTPQDAGGDSSSTQPLGAITLFCSTGRGQDWCSRPLRWVGSKHYGQLRSTSDLGHNRSRCCPGPASVASPGGVSDFGSRAPGNGAQSLINPGSAPGDSANSSSERLRRTSTCSETLNRANTDTA